MLHEKIRSVGIALGEMAGRVNPDDWRKLSAARDELAALANEAEALETQGEAATSNKKSGKAAKEGA